MTKPTSSDTTLLDQFNAIYGQSSEPVRHFFAPGRVNLIGEYTDFNGGMVLPCGIERGIHLLVRQTAGNHAGFASANLPHRASIDLGTAITHDGDNWTNYPLGVFREFTQRNCTLEGMQLYYAGNVPDGAGLSSSAAIEVVTACALNSLYSMQLENSELALLSQSAENNFVKVQCGIMDQFAVAMAMADHAIALQCNTLEYEQVPLGLGDYRLLISNTGQRRELAASAYNERVRECNSALAQLQPGTGATQLADVSPQQLDEQLRQHTDLLTDPVTRKRAIHVIEENHRVKVATKLLQKGDLEGFGQLMNDSHQSLKDNFNVSSNALDKLVELACASDGVLGSRMTGAGFGGCTVTLIHKDAIADMIEKISHVYTSTTGYTAEYYPTAATAGVREIVS